MPNSFLPFPEPHPVAPSATEPGSSLRCPNPGCGGTLGPLAGAEDLFCAACCTVVVLLRDGVAIWHSRQAEPRRCSVRALRASAAAC